MKFRTTGRIRQLVDRITGPAITVLFSVAAMAQALRVWQWRPGDPMAVGGDATGVTAQIKGMLDHGWYYSNPDLGAPFGQDARLYPNADHVHLFLIRLIGFFSDNPFTVGALYFMLGFPLAALSMYWLARQRGLNRAGAVVAGVLFSVLPGHQLKYGHLLLAYWVVPFGIWLVLRTALGEPLFRVNVAWRDSILRRQALLLNVTTTFCVLCIALGGIYYSAFTLLLLAVTLLVRMVATRDLRAIARGALLLVAIGAVSLSAAISVTAGQNKSTIVSMPGQRGFFESEVFAGKFMDLVLPWIHHRVAIFSQVTVAYNSLTTPTAEEPALGVIALAGVVALIVMTLSALVRQRVKPVHPELRMLGVLTLVALCFYSIGGLGSFVALFVTPQLRTWSRFFVLIGLFGLLAVGHWVTHLSQRNRLLGAVTAAAVLVIGVLDQTNPAVAPNYKALRAEVENLTTFSRSIEARVGPGCSVFQLPIVSFPENPPVHDMADYDHFRPYLTPTSLRWSYGAYRGTSLADWQLALPQTSSADLVDDVVAAGFCSIELDRAGFSDRGSKFDNELTALLGPPISTTHDGRLLAWDLSPARRALTSRVGKQQLDATGYLVLHPVVLYINGAHEVTHDQQKPYQWTGQSPDIDVHNFARTTIARVHVTFSLAAPTGASRRFTVHLPNGSTQLVDAVDGAMHQVQVIIDAAPGRNTIAITTTGAGETIARASSSITEDRGIVYGKLIDLQAHVPDAKIHIGVLQQRIG
jgi:hypothetical protein